MSWSSLKMVPLVASGDCMRFTSSILACMCFFLRLLEHHGPRGKLTDQIHLGKETWWQLLLSMAASWMAGPTSPAFPASPSSCRASWLRTSIPPAADLDPASSPPGTPAVGFLPFRVHKSAMSRTGICTPRLDYSQGTLGGSDDFPQNRYSAKFKGRLPFFSAHKKSFG